MNASAGEGLCDPISDFSGDPNFDDVVSNRDKATPPVNTTRANTPSVLQSHVNSLANLTTNFESKMLRPNLAQHWALFHAPPYAPLVLRRAAIKRGLL
ncbi:Hypothetical predicted protein [Olea europaea subsp. europaea]|uniref:Uncharacterized protein n=1 Tax=Olea europaea subsp. europaea TaxID=158383 RepID=A0A8S0T7N4_OLEEU|nr:Hypothetical predicted protein [Olea europaea subsp. europaea]